MRFLIKPITVNEKAHGGCGVKGGSCGKDCSFQCVSLACPAKGACPFK